MRIDEMPGQRFNVYDPKDLTVEQLMKVLNLDERHRIVDMGDKAIIVDWDAVMDDDRWIRRPAD